MCVCGTVYVPATDDEFYAFYIGLQLYYVYGYTVGMSKKQNGYFQSSK